MKNVILTLCLSVIISFVSAQNANDVKAINQVVTNPSALAPLYFLASDELKGRGSMRPEIHIAARYIGEAFRSAGLKEVPGTNDYFQNFNLIVKKPATEGTLTANGSTFSLAQTLVHVKGNDTSIKAPLVYAAYGIENELKNIDVRGKIVVTEPGENSSSTFMQGYYMLGTERKLLQEKGAAALVVRFKEGSIPWNVLQRHLSGETIMEEEDAGIPVFIVKDDAATLKSIPNGAEGALAVQGIQISTVPAKNVMGWVEGTDPKLKSQYVVLSAHYDHLGVAKQPKMEEGKMDSIYNGARDNAIGTTAVIDAARYFAQHPPKRSMLFIAYAAEEVGEIGSKYFANHSPIPLKQLVYNLNIDNASYNDTSIVTVIGLGRTSTDDDIKKAAAAFGLQAMPDPAPEQNLFDRSDNAQLAVKGIPSPNYSLGFRKFDDEINKRYHQLSDEVGNFNLNYAMKYIRSFVLTAQLIADNPKQPEWIKGDKYEAAWKQLYK